MKNILCKLGFHRQEKDFYLRVTRHHKNGMAYHRNYVVCKRCGKRLATLAKQKTGGKNDG
ncbi:MAG: hypothetical protein IJX94_01260 [Clostridia bacterium]|nr:hypothetical protein [Clostridia bacterium]